ncbi:hypothetical protein QBC38DRAFT_168062 [Podospora fimiseda]|uniref:Fungal STAND N-terminal Goodbye domain-containing protein n=1 Tax=Podospora fimiseda TaxID=252190 RepID=A0AAN7H0G7_9PEZI|nr:hypothetical protein QBC38DRAFT_168062 [Podospora fimiseda]
MNSFALSLSLSLSLSAKPQPPLQYHNRQFVMGNESLQSTAQGHTLWSGEEEDELRQIWQGVVSRVHSMAGNVEGANFDPNLDINGVLELVNRTRAAGKESSSSGAVGVIHKTLNCIQIVGGLVADAASNVFGAANACFNALNFVIQAYQNYQGIFQSLEGLLEKCLQFLQRLSFYENKMDSTLRKVVCSHLALFVEICEYIISLRGKRNRVKAFVKTTFLGDSHVQELLENMKNLNEHEHGIVNAQTFNQVKITGEVVKSVNQKFDLFAGFQKEERAEQKAEKEQRKLVAKFLTIVGYDRDGDELPREPTRTWQSSISLLPMGDWIKDNAQFRKWADGNGPGSYILGLEGGTGSGKTALAAGIIKLLQRRGTGDTKSRSSVAYYIYKADYKNTDSDDQIANIVSRSLLCQLANDTAFLKSAVAAVGDKSKGWDQSDLWTEMVLENKDLTTMSSTYFLVIDGLAEDDQFKPFLLPLLRRLMQNPTCPVKVLLTGKRLSSFLGLITDNGAAFPVIQISRANSDDVKLFIKDRLDQMDFLKNQEKPEVAERVKKTILETLQRTTDGNYTKIKQALDKINDSPEQLSQILQEAGTADASQDFEKNIERLNHTMTPNSITYINEVILWILKGRAWFQPHVLEGALKLKDRVDCDDERPPESSLSLLRHIIVTDKYLIFDINEGSVKFKTLSVSEAEKKLPNTNTSGSSTSLNSTSNIDRAEVDIVRHYLTTVCPSYLYAKLGFDAFFEAKRSRNAHYVCQDPDNGELLIALRCLACLVKQRSVKIEGEVHGYAVGSLYSHLYSAEFDSAEGDTDFERGGRLTSANYEYRRKAGVLLLKLFTEEYAIKSFLGPLSFFDENEHESSLAGLVVPSHWSEWILSDNGIKVLQIFFRDRAVSDNIKDAAMVKEIAKSGADAFEVLFEPAIKVLGTRLLEENASNAEVENIFFFLLAVRAKLDGSAEKFPEGYLCDIDLERLQQLESWFRGKLGDLRFDDVLESTWEARFASLVHRLAPIQTKSLRKGRGIKLSDAEARARKALEINPTNWRASYTLAQVVALPSQSIQILESVVSLLSGPDYKGWREEQGNRMRLAEVLFTLGERCFALSEPDRFEKATDAYFRGLDIDKTYHPGYLKAVSLYAGEKLWTRIVDFLDRLVNSNLTAKGSISPGARLIIEGVKDGDEVLSQQLINTAKNLGNWDLLNHLFKLAMAQLPVDDNNPMTAYWLRRMYGRVLMKEPNRESEGLEVLWGLTKLSQYSWLLEMTIEELMPIYTPRIRKASPESAQPYASKVEDLYKLFTAASSDMASSKIPVLYFARYFLVSEDLSRAKEVVQKMLTVYLDMLSDDDPSNDYWAFWVLGELFAVSRDKINTVAAWDAAVAVNKGNGEKAFQKALDDWADKSKNKVISNPEGDTAKSVVSAEDGQAEREAGEDSGSEKPKLEDYLGIIWCGSCGLRWNHLSDVWVCMDNYANVHLHDKCYQAFMRGETLLDNNHYCITDHEFFYIEERDIEKVFSVPVGYVRIGEEEITLEEWKDRIRKQYLDLSS